MIRLPEGGAIERALIEGLSDTVVISTLNAVCDTFGITAPAGLDTQTGPALLKSVVGILKKNGGLHAQFIELLPPNTTPPVLQAILDAILDSGDNRLDGLHQL